MKTVWPIVGIIFFEKRSAPETQDREISRYLERFPNSEIDTSVEGTKSLVETLNNSGNFPIAIEELSSSTSFLEIEKFKGKYKETMFVCGRGKNVPLLWMGEKAPRWELKNGKQEDLLATALAIAGIEIPDDLEGESLLLNLQVLMDC